MMEAMLSWFVNNWEKFNIWVTNQPTFVEVALGIGLFYVALQIVKTLYKLIVILFSLLFTSPVRFKKLKDLRPKLRKRKTANPDDDTPPFVFR